GLLPAPRRDRHPPGDRTHPGERLVILADRRPALPRPGERLLGAVLGDGHVPGGRVDQMDHPRCRGAIELLEVLLRCRRAHGPPPRGGVITTLPHRGTYLHTSVTLGRLHRDQTGRAQGENYVDWVAAGLRP